MKLFNTKKKIAAAALAGLAVLGTGVGALAYWTSSGSGVGSGSTGTSVDFDIDSSAATGDPLSPDGPTQTIAYTVTNPGSGVQNLESVVVKVANADGTAWTSVAGCSAADYSVGGEDAGLPYTVTPDVELASNGIYNGSASLQMVNTNSDQDGCKNATVPLHISAS
jgi:hypothetical protein